MESEILGPILSSPNRLPSDRAKDATRNPVAVLSALNLIQNQRFLDFTGGDGYWSVLASALVGKGVGVWIHNPEENRNIIEPQIKQRLALTDPQQNPSNLRFFFSPFRYPQPPTPPFCTKPECYNCKAQWPGWDGQFDVVFAYASYVTAAATALPPTPAVELSPPLTNYGTPQPDSTDMAGDINAHVYRLLRPGGRYIIIDNAAVPGSDVGVSSHLNRIDEIGVVQQVTKAGFEFVEEYVSLRNPSDPRTGPAGDYTDRFQLKFIKPGGSEQVEAAMRCLVGHW